jgi:CRISPR/Cas system CSM-associated protein Csm2 small subunit
MKYIIYFLNIVKKKKHNGVNEYIQKKINEYNKYCDINLNINNINNTNNINISKNQLYTIFKFIDDFSY